MLRNGGEDRIPLPSLPLQAVFRDGGLAQSLAAAEASSETNVVLFELDEVQNEALDDAVADKELEVVVGAEDREFLFVLDDLVRAPLALEVLRDLHYQRGPLVLNIYEVLLLVLNLILGEVQALRLLVFEGAGRVHFELDFADVREDEPRVVVLALFGRDRKLLTHLE